MLVGDTVAKERRTGVQRVVLETARALPGLVDFNLVGWDQLEGRLRFLDTHELDRLFGPGDWPPGLQVQPQARALGRRFQDQLPRPLDTWLLIPEVAWHERHGVELLARAMAQCREWGGRSAAIFYDLIPISNPAYRAHAMDHEAYLAQLVKADLIIPISRTSGIDLDKLWKERGVAPHPPIAPLLLPDGGFHVGRTPRPTGTASNGHILMFGTIEPRKRQVETLEAVERARMRSTALASRQVIVVGSVHPATAKAFNGLVRRNSWLTHLDYVDDHHLDQLVGGAAFTVFASQDEGYGLPISESLAAGIPCLCANFGSMAEIAAGGGCLTVDVRQDQALEAALIRLCEDTSALALLSEAITQRRFQSWSDYASALADLLPPAAPCLAAVTTETADGPLTEAAFVRMAKADIVGFPNVASRDDFITEAGTRHWPELLPQLLLAERVSAAETALAEERGRRQALAQMEKAYAAARQSAPDAKASPVFLRILISTYNRRDFVLANARWILNKVLIRADYPVELMVVDGGSTDGTVEGLYQINDSRLKIVECPTNVGMLAGIREAARLPGADYIWLVGDDDFIDPAAFSDLARALRTHVGVPFAFTNFAVYHRAALSASDTAGRLVLEGQPVGKDVAPSGLMSVRDIAAQTDNLFTAIYTIIWRSDLIAATYEHTFDGPPFQDLTEAIPCTDFILRRYADCLAFWHAGVGVVGNAHNSWSRHRPRWHGVIMPLAFSLARDAGVDPVRLQSWAGTHLGLLQEAIDIARDNGWSPTLRAAEADDALRMFRTRPPGFPT